MLFFRYIFYSHVDILNYHHTHHFIHIVQAKCLENGEIVAIKKVLQDKRYKNRELQIMQLLDHPNVVQLKHHFYSTTSKDQLYLNLVLEYVPETLYRVLKQHNKIHQHMPLIYVKLYIYQVITDFCLYFRVCFDSDAKLNL